MNGGEGQPYWTEALHEMSQAMQDGGRLVTIDVKKIEDQLFMENGPESPQIIQTLPSR